MHRVLNMQSTGCHHEKTKQNTQSVAASNLVWKKEIRRNLYMIWQLISDCLLYIVINNIGAIYSWIQIEKLVKYTSLVENTLYVPSTEVQKKYQKCILVIDFIYAFSNCSVK